MTRELKFRAWDGRRMLDDVIPYANECVVTFSEYEHDVSSVNHIMQYTGLKDKNGVDIYEGDILKSSELIASVKWGELPGFVWGSVYLTSDIDWDFEVIGNIYQHPDLAGDQTRKEND